MNIDRFRRLRLLQGMLYRRICAFLPVQMNIVTHMDLFLDSKYSITTFAEIFASRTYYPAIELLNHPPTRILDIGANEGIFTLFAECNLRQRFKNFDTTYTLVEANPALTHRIDRNLQLAGMKGRYSLLKGAAGKRSGETRFAIGRSLICSGVEPTDRVAKWIDISYLDIEQELAKTQQGVPELIKIDIEGAEGEFFENYRDWLGNACVVIVEHHSHAVSPSHWRQLVGQAGLTLHEITAKSGQTTTEILVNRDRLNEFNSRRSTGQLRNPVDAALTLNAVD